MNCRKILRDRELLGLLDCLYELFLFERFYNVWFVLLPLPSKARETNSEKIGIVSLLFCGITLKHYAYHNMSIRTQRTSKYMFGLLAQLSENFIFIYLGLSLFTQDELVYKPMFIFVTAVS